MKTVQLILPPLGPHQDWRVHDVPVKSPRGPWQILIAPGALVMSREVGAVGRTNAQARAAALATLASEMAMPASDCVCAVAPAGTGRMTAHIIARRARDDLVAAARAQGHAPDAIIADFALLPAPQADAAIVAQRGDCLVRTTAAAFACQPDLLPLLLGERTTHQIDFETAASEAIREGRHQQQPNLMTAVAEAKTHARSPAPIVALLAAAAALGVFAALPWLEAGQLNRATAQLHAEAEILARKALPGAQRIVNPLAQLREASLPRARAAAGLGHVVTVVEGLARAPGVAIARLSFDGETVSAHVGVPSTALLQPLRDHVAANGLQLVETPGLSEPNNIPVELTIEVAP